MIIMHLRVNLRREANERMMFHWLLGKILPVQVIASSLVHPIMPDRPKLFDVVLMLEAQSQAKV